MTEPVVRDRPLLFRPIAGLRAHEEVVDQIAFAIRSGAYRVGDRLPLVEELAKGMNVSKPTVGEALRALSRDGVVKTQRGANGGVTVISDNIPRTIPGVAEGTRETGLRELVEARRAVEMEIARLAAKRATEDDFQYMEEAVDGLAAHRSGDRATRLHYDYLFHYAMGRAARSDLLAYYQHQILDEMVKAMEEYLAEEEDPDEVVKLHKRTLGELRRGDQARIDKVMEEHLRFFSAAVTEKGLIR